MHFSTVDKKKILFNIIFLVTLGQLAIDIYTPSMQHMAVSLKASEFSVKLTLSLYLLGYGVSQLFYGSLSDFLGRRPLLHTGMIVFLLSTVGCVFSKSIHTLIIFRVLQGMGLGGAVSQQRAMTRDSFHGKEMAKVSSIVVMVWSMAPIIAPVIGGYVQKFFGWRGNFAFMLMYVICVWILVLFTLPETLLEKEMKFNPKKIFKNYKTVFTNKVFLSFTFLSAVVYAYLLTFATAGPFLLQGSLHLTAVQFGWSFLLVAFGYGIGSFVCSKIVHRFKIMTLLIAGSVIMFLGTLSLLICSIVNIFTVKSVLIPIFVSSLGGGLIFPNCTTAALTPFKKIGGTAGAAIGFFQMMGCFVASAIAGKISTKKLYPIAIELFIISIVALLILFLGCRKVYEEEI